MDLVVRPRLAEDVPALCELVMRQQPLTQYPFRNPLPFPVEDFVVRSGELAAWVAELEPASPVGHVSLCEVGDHHLGPRWAEAVGRPVSDLAAVSVRESLTGAGLLTSPADVRNAPLVLVVLPPGADGPASSLATRTVLTGLMTGLGHNAAGVVVAGDEDSADQGQLAALREGEVVGPVSTVDGIETTIGQVTAVLAMEAVISGSTGSFGASGSDGVVPLG